ncbi:DEAD/DEAH box helicase [Sporolactobacillus sp. THM7-4]|nr:DEAD/DEAH box helicase [Sporolactobacillus sp. THM7-4]
MTRYFQMTFVPHIENGSNFYIWLTNEQGKPVAFPDRNSGESVPGWLGEHSPFRTFPSPASFVSGGQLITVSGAMMTMESAFRLMQDKVLVNRQGEIRPGKTFQWFSQIADALQILLERGHFYPFMYHLERGNHEHCFFCEWMPDGRLITESALFADWLSRLPRLAFSIVDLQDEKVRQWLYLIVIYWTNALVRSFSHDEWVSPESIPYLSEKKAADKELFQRVLNESYPFNHSERPWIVTCDPVEINQLNALEQEMSEWVRPIADHTGGWTEALINYRKTQQQLFFAPETAKITLNPVDPDDLFSKSSIWEYDIAIQGWQNGQPAEWSMERLKRLQSLDKSTWFDDRLRSLRGKVPAEVLRHLSERPYGILSASEVSSLYQDKDKLSAASIKLIFPDDLRIREADHPVEIDLDIRQDTDGQDSLFSLASLINYDWRIAIGDIQLSPAEFTRLVRENQSFIRHGNVWVHLPFDQMMKAYEEMGDTLDFLDKKPSVKNVLQIQAMRRQKRKRMIHVHLNDSLNSYLEHLLRKPSRNIPLPESFKGKLRPYQKKGYTWLATLRHQHVGGCLADDMGLGKTVQTIAYLDYCKTVPDEPLPEGVLQSGPHLIVCPTSLVSNWKHEFQTFSPNLNIYIHHGSGRLHGDPFLDRLAESDVMITSYSIFTKEANNLQSIYWKSVILDEAQAIKNPHAQKTRALRSVRTAHRLVLTGTPIENRLEELWSIMDFLNPGYLGSLEYFRKQFIRPVEKKNSKSRARLLTKIIQPFLLRREKTDKKIIHDLPDKVETKETCYLSKDQASLYQSFVNRLAKNVSATAGIQRRGLILSTLTKLKQVCDHPGLVLEKPEDKKKSGKLDLFFDLLNPLFEQNERVLVFTQYVQMGRLLAREVGNRYPDSTVLFLHGGLSSDQREKLIRQFQNNDSRKTLFILSLKAGGVGINLTAANYVIHYDRWWNPAVEEQATDRAYRIGQNKNVHVYKLICEGTLEERIDQLIERKKGLQKQILGQGEAWLTEMSDREIYDLIKLREGVI